MLIDCAYSTAKIADMIGVLHCGKHTEKSLQSQILTGSSDGR
jgi:hypothetical protein